MSQSKFIKNIKYRYSTLMNMGSEKYLHVVSGQLCIMLSVTAVVDFEM